MLGYILLESSTLKKRRSHSFSSEILAEYKERLSLLRNICKDADRASEKLFNGKAEIVAITEAEAKLIGPRCVKLITLNKYDYTTIFYLDYAHKKLVMVKTDRFAVRLTSNDHVSLEFDRNIIVETLSGKDWSNGELRMLHSSIKYMLK
jgi:hypothetical protein